MVDIYATLHSRLFLVSQSQNLPTEFISAKDQVAFRQASSNLILEKN